MLGILPGTLFESPVVWENIDKHSCTTPTAVAFNNYPILHGKKIGASAFGELWEIDGRKGFLHYDGSRWTLSAIGSGLLGDHEYLAVASILTAVSGGLDAEVANIETAINIRVGFAERKDIVFRGYLDKVDEEGRTYVVKDEDGTFEVLVPDDKRQPCTCECDCFKANFEPTLESDDEDESYPPFTCNHIDALAELDENRSRRRIYREDAFVPCEYWN